MKKIFIGLSMFAIFNILISCNKKVSEDYGSDDSTTAIASTPSAVLKNDMLNAMYEHYNHLYDALTKEDMNAAKVAANAIEAGAKQLGDGSTIAHEAAVITSANNIEVQRTAFAVISKNMTEMIRLQGLSNGQLYIAYCPMALDNKGAWWLTNNNEIRNPYFGEKMINCGEVEETIK